MATLTERPVRQIAIRLRDQAARLIDPRAAAAGALASVAYAAEMYADIAATGYRFDDVQLVESAIRGRTARVPLLGMAVHLANGAGLGMLYSAFVRPHLHGPGWARGIIFGLGFLAAVWPTTPLVDRSHPLIRRGELPKLAAPTPFAQNLARHLVFGAVLGALCAAWERIPTKM